MLANEVTWFLFVNEILGSAADDYLSILRKSVP